MHQITTINSAESSALKYYLLINDTHRGPYSQEQILAMLQNNNITPYTIFAEEGADRWRPVSELVGTLELVEAHAPVNNKPVEEWSDQEIGMPEVIPDYVKVCLDCGTVGDSQSRTKGSIATELVLWCFFLLPGMIYSAWRLSSRDKCCRKCGSTHLIPGSSPNARDLVRKYLIWKIKNPEYEESNRGLLIAWLAIIILGLAAFIWWSIPK